MGSVVKMPPGPEDVHPCSELWPALQQLRSSQTLYSYSFFLLFEVVPFGFLVPTVLN